MPEPILCSRCGKELRGGPLQHLTPEDRAACPPGHEDWWKAEVRKMAETDHDKDIYPYDIATEILAIAVHRGEISRHDEDAKEILHTEAQNYAERYYSENGYEF